ncbi:hypothetical protein AMS68_002834 [Peltaster fructicola]|uniref:NADP-dependent oxidoreductase domain-containing protein n=1 Tax=Peltaster fructicola TaxID=286661 RepID=A0A6H0XRD2_9PEZI|nr:hypothetical protein AMS68_002834 [Peltaster fructicola]
MPSLLGRHRQLAPSAAVRVSPLCLGAMTFGTASPERYGEVSKETAFEIMDTFYKQGGNFIDTANAYRNGESEVWVGEWMKARGNRDEIVLATKFASAYRGHEKDKIQTNFVGTGTKSMKLSLDASLKKLQTSYIDLFYVHWWDFTTNIPELMHSLNDLVVAGKVLYLGISDTPAWVVAKANQYARDHGLRPFVVYQGLWNASVRDFERDIIPMCRDEGMGLCPWGVLNQGRFQTEAAFKEREEKNEGRGNFGPPTEHDKRISKVLEDISSSKGCTLQAVALAYCLQKTPYVFPLVGQRKVEHLQGSIDALSVVLTEKEISAIEEAYPFALGFPHDFLNGAQIQGKKSVMTTHPGQIWLTNAGGAVIDFVEDAKPIQPKTDG